MTLVLPGRLRRMDSFEGLAVGAVLSEAAAGLRDVPAHVAKHAAANDVAPRTIARRVDHDAV